jgi:hypothetical protein
MQSAPAACPAAVTRGSGDGARARRSSSAATWRLDYGRGNDAMPWPSIRSPPGVRGTGRRSGLVARPGAGDLLEGARAASVDRCLREPEERALERGGSQELTPTYSLCFGFGGSSLSETRFHTCLKTAPASSPPRTPKSSPKGR